MERQRGGRSGKERRLCAALAGALLLILATPAGAQRVPRLPLSLEVRAGAAVPTGEVDDVPGIGAEAGAHARVAAVVRLTNALAVYAGYGRSWFRCSRCEERGLDDTVVDTGFDLGVEARVPAGPLPVAPWIRFGGLLHELVLSGFGGTLESERGLGFRVAAGVGFPLAGSLRFTPGISYGSHPAELDLGGLADRTVDVGHFTVDLGLRYTF